MNPLPELSLATALFEWTRGARNRLLRLADLPRRKDILEIGCGWGLLSEELASRVADAHIVAVDREPAAIEHVSARSPDNVTAVLADVHALPSGLGPFDMIVSHFAFLWFRDPAAVVGECCRVLRDDGVILAVEPDYGGLMEHPDVGRRRRWIDELSAQRADPFIGRKLPSLLRRYGLQVQVLFCDRYVPYDPRADSFLDASPDPTPDATVFLPLWLVHGAKGQGT